MLLWAPKIPFSNHLKITWDRCFGVLQQMCILKQKIWANNVSLTKISVLICDILFSLTCQSPLSSAMCVAAVEEHIGVITWAVGRVGLQERVEFGLYRIQCKSTSGVVTAMCLNHVVREELLHVVQHACGTQVQLLHLIWG